MASCAGTRRIAAALLAMAALRERPRPRTLMGIGIGLAGVALVSLGESGGLIEKPYLARYPALDVTAWGFWARTALLLPFAGQLARTIAIAPPSATLSVLYLGIFPAAFGYVGWSIVLARMEVARATALLYLALVSRPPGREGTPRRVRLPRPRVLEGSAVGAAMRQRQRSRHVA